MNVRINGVEDRMTCLENRMTCLETRMASFESRQNGFDKMVKINDDGIKMILDLLFPGGKEEKEDKHDDKSVS